MRRSSYLAGSFRLAAAAGLAAAFVLMGPGAGVAAPESVPGEACLFSAPFGAVPSGGLVGHIGWGYRDGTGDDWTFGATEGLPYTAIVSAGGDTHSWTKGGTLADMLSAFGTGNHPYGNGPGYYLQYRCTMVTASNPSAALTAVINGENSGYNLANDNCLTKSVAILQAYGVPSLPNVPPLPPGDLPNHYFTSELPSFPSYNPGFNSVQYFTTLTVGAKLLDPLDNVYLNTDPVHTQRPMRIQIRDSSGNLVYDSGFNITATVTPNTDRYQATVQLPSPSLISSALQSWSGTASYTMTVQLATTPGDPRGLTLPSADNVTITPAAANTPPDISLTAGDINGDGYVDVKDYDLLLQCYSDLLPPKGPCDSGLKAAADLDDDGNVNQYDYNELIRVYSYLLKVSG